MIDRYMGHSLTYIHACMHTDRIVQINEESCNLFLMLQGQIKITVMQQPPLQSESVCFNKIGEQTRTGAPQCT